VIEDGQWCAVGIGEILQTCRPDIPHERVSAWVFVCMRLFSVLVCAQILTYARLRCRRLRAFVDVETSLFACMCVLAIFILAFGRVCVHVHVLVSDGTHVHVWTYVRINLRE